MAILTWIENHPGLAAWVQAVGTIAAIVFAVWLPAHERRLLEKTAEVAARTPVMAAMVALTEVWNFLRSGSPSAEVKAKITANLTAADQALSGFALQILNPRAAVAFQGVRDAFQMAVRGFRDSRMLPLGNMYLRSAFLEHVQVLLEHAPALFDDSIKLGLVRALRETAAEIATRTSNGEKPDDYGV